MASPAHVEPFRPFQTMAVGLAVISPTSSVFAILVPVAITLGPGTLVSYALASLVGGLVAFTYVTTATQAHEAPGEPHWVARALGPPWGSGMAVLTVTSLVVVCALLLQALGAVVGAEGWWHLVALGIAITSAATFGVRRTVWLIVLGLAVELTSLGVVTGEALSSSDTNAIAAHISSAAVGFGGAQLAAVPAVLFAINGYGQAAYLVGDSGDRGARVSRVVFGTYVLAVLAEGIPLAVISLSLPPGSDAVGDFPLLTLLDDMRVAPAALTAVHVGIGFALANALLSTLHFGARLLAPIQTTRPGRSPSTRSPRSLVADSPATRRRTLVLGAAMVLFAALSPESLTIGAGQSLVVVYLFVAAAAVRVATTPWRRVLAAALATVMALLLARGGLTDPAQVAAALGVFTIGLTWNVRLRSTCRRRASPCRPSPWSPSRGPRR